MRRKKIEVLLLSIVTNWCWTAVRQVDLGLTWFTLPQTTPIFLIRLMYNLYSYLCPSICKIVREHVLTCKQFEWFKYIYKSDLSWVFQWWTKWWFSQPILRWLSRHCDMYPAVGIRTYKGWKWESLSSWIRLLILNITQIVWRAKMGGLRSNGALMHDA